MQETWEGKTRKVLAVDLDGTLLKYSGWKGETEFGEPIEGVKEELRKVRDAGWVIVICASRNQPEALKAHLDKHNIPFDHINENPYGPPRTGPKIFADVYLDDRAINFNGKTEGLADRILNFRPWYGKSIDCSNRVAELYRNLSEETQEVFVVIALDSKNKIIADKEVHRGTLTYVDVDPRVVFRFLVEKGAASTIIVHNHPSGDPSPSAEDRTMCDRLCQAGSLLNITILDFIIIGEESKFSFADCYLLNYEESKRKEELVLSGRNHSKSKKHKKEMFDKLKREMYETPLSVHQSLTGHVTLSSKQQGDVWLEEDLMKTQERYLEQVMGKQSDRR